MLGLRSQLHGNSGIPQTYTLDLTTDSQATQKAQLKQARII